MRKTKICYHLLKEPIKCLLCNHFIADDLFDYFIHFESHVNYDDQICQYCKRDITQFDTEQRERHFSYHIFNIVSNHYSQIIIEKEKLPPCKYERMDQEIPNFPTPFKCDWTNCNEEFNKLYSFYSHVYNHPKIEDDEKIILKCQWNDCDYASKTTRILVRHMNVHTAQRLYSCTICNTRFSFRDSFINHFNRQVPEEEIVDDQFKCLRCFKIFKTKRLLSIHSERHVNFEKCPYCDFTGNRKDNIATHIKWKHSNVRPFACEYCDFRTVSQASLTYHVEHIHINPKKKERAGRKTCEICQTQFFKISALTLHMTIIHKIKLNDKQFKCHLCPNVVYGRGHLLTQHYVNIHNFEKKDSLNRFHYILHPDGIYRLSLTRLESVKVTQKLLEDEESINCE